MRRDSARRAVSMARSRAQTWSTDTEVSPITAMFNLLTNVKFFLEHPTADYATQKDKIVAKIKEVQLNAAPYVVASEVYK
jgi:hypothetical protein